jgi:excisionase family DNA binding protein
MSFLVFLCEISRMKTTETKPTGAIMTVPEAAAFTRLTKSTVYAYVARRELPHLKIGSRVLFDRNELQGWLDEHRIPALDKPPARDGGE